MTSIRLACLAPVTAFFVFVSAPNVTAGQDFSFVSSTGNDSNSCTAASPCAEILFALGPLNNGGQVSCINMPSFSEPDLVDGGPDFYTIDCSGVIASASNPAGVILSYIGSITVKIRNLTFNGQPSSATGAISVSGSGSLILENCVFENFGNGTGPALLMEPNGPLNLMIRNSRILNNSGGILLKPAVGGSINATLDHVTITDNIAGGLKSDTTNGPVTVDITDSVISNNGADGINTVGNAGGQAMVSIKNSVIAKNGLEGVVANGTNAAVLLQMTLLDQNAAGATSVVSGGHISTYGNNSIVGSAGSGFTASAPLQ